MERSQAHSQEATRERPMALDRMQAGRVGRWILVRKGRIWDGRDQQGFSRWANGGGRF